MSRLQVILEEPESALTRRKKQCGTTLVYRPNIPKPPEPVNHVSTSHLQSEESSNEDELDSEVKKIKEMTNNLQLSICSELKHHKKAYLQYIESNKALNSLVKSYTTEIEEVKSTAQTALVQSIQTCSELKRIRESVAGRESRISNENEENHLEILNNMKKEIQNMQEKLYTNELIIEEKEKENTDLKNYIDTHSDKNRSYLEKQETKIGCSKCSIV